MGGRNEPEILIIKDIAYMMEPSVLKLDSATAFGASPAFPSGREAIAVGHDIDMNDIMVPPEGPL